MQVKKLQLEQDMEQGTSSKLGQLAASLVRAQRRAPPAILADGGHHLAHHGGGAGLRVPGGAREPRAASSELRQRN